MNISDLIVEVRNSSLTRVGQLLPVDLVGFKAVLRFNNVGSWSIDLPVGNAMAEQLRLPNAGIIVTLPSGVMFSGYTSKAVRVQTQDDPTGVWQISGVTDDVILGERLAYPTPATADLTAQTSEYDIRTGKASTLMYQYINANIGSSAPAARKISTLTTATDLALGSTLTTKARYETLGSLMERLAVIDGLGFDIKQSGSGLVFRVYQPTDRSATVRMDIDNNRLTKSEYTYSAPEATRAIVAGTGTGTARLMAEVTTTASTAAETAWGRRIEVFKDARGESQAQLVQAGTEELADKGKTIEAISVSPSDDLSMAYGTDWNLGDKISVVAGTTTVTQIVTEVGLIVAEDGIRIGATVGEPAVADPESSLVEVQADQEQRLSNLERNESAPNSVSTTQIVDASVTSAKIADGSVNTAEIADNAVTTAKIANGAVTSAKLSGSITATNVTQTVTGTTSAELVRGNMADNDQFRILVGGTASNAGYAEIATADDGNEPIYVRQYTGVFGTVTRTATLLDGSGNTGFPGSVSAGSFSTGGNVSCSSIYAGNWFRSNGQSGWYSETYGGGIWMNDSTWIRTYGGKNFYCSATLGSSSIYSDNSISANNGLYYGVNSQYISIRNDGSNYFQSSNTYGRTYASAANVYVTAAGVIGRATSASKYKIAIEEAVDDFTKVLNLKPKTWFDKRIVETHADYLTALANGEEAIESVDKEPIQRHSGLVAEDLVEAGLEVFVQYGEYKEDGTREVEGIQYDRLWTYLIPLVKDLRERVTQLETLEARISALEGKA